MLLEDAQWIRQKLAGIRGIKVMGKEVVTGDARFAMEETKIYFNISDLGVNGFEAEDWLMAEHKTALALSDERSLLATLTVGNDGRSCRKLIKAIRALAKWAKADRENRKGVPNDLPRLCDLKTKLVMTPAEAFAARCDRVPLAEAAGRVIAKMVSPYPPGIPSLSPGERITPVHVKYFQMGLELGFFVMDPSDMSLATLRVVQE
jgi:arginine decarboxylase